MNVHKSSKQSLYFKTQMWMISFTGTAHENEAVQQKGKENNASGKRGAVFPVRPFPAPSSSSARRNWWRTSTGITGGRAGKMTCRNLQIKWKMRADLIQIYLWENLPPLSFGEESSLSHKASLSFGSSERMDNLHHENTRPAGIPSTRTDCHQMPS